MNKQTIHTSTACFAPVPPEIEGNSPVVGLSTKRFLTCRCKTCNGWTFLSWYDSLEDIEGANKELKRLRKEGRDPQIEEFQQNDSMPDFCCCYRPKKSEKAPE